MRARIDVLLLACDIDVAPGPGTPLQGAIDAAAPKDRIRVQSGTYAETIVVNKPLRIAAKDGARIDGGCTVTSTVTIASDAVRLEGFSVRGATFSQVEIGPHHKVFVRVGGVPDCAGVRHGIRAVGVKQLTIKNPSYFQFDTSGGTLGCHGPLTPNERLYEDAAVYVTGTQLGAKVRISDAFMCLVSTGIRLENIVRGPKAPRPVVLQRNRVLLAYRGILLQNTDGTAVQSSSTDALQPGAIAGIELERRVVGQRPGAEKDRGLPRRRRGRGCEQLLAADDVRDRDAAVRRLSLKKPVRCRERAPAAAAAAG